MKRPVANRQDAGPTDVFMFLCSSLAMAVGINP
jgi:hypothetical protein